MYCSVLTSDMVDIFVGPKRKRFHLHKELLCDRSEYFRAVFQGGFAESASNELFLPDDDVAALEIFVNWIYGAQLRQPTRIEELHTYLALLALSEKFVTEYLQNTTSDLIRGFYRQSGSKVGPEDIMFVYENTTGRKMCGFMAGLVALQLSLNETHPEYDKDLLSALQGPLASAGPFAGDFTWFLMQTRCFSPSYAAARISELLAHDNSCSFHYHDRTPLCKGPAILTYHVPPTN
jgi:hypothetical protein